MTGEMEEVRKVKPDPKHPTILNGDFEQVIGNPPQVAGWHYQRQMEVVTADDAPSGKRYVRFHNSRAGPRRPGPARLRRRRPLSSANWNFPSASAITTSVRVPWRSNCRWWQCTFYDENRATIGDKRLGPWRGSSDWKTEAKKLDVPVRRPRGDHSHRPVRRHGRTVAGRLAHEGLAVKREWTVDGERWTVNGGRWTVDGGR